MIGAEEDAAADILLHSIGKGHQSPAREHPLRSAPFIPGDLHNRDLRSRRRPPLERLDDRFLLVAKLFQGHFVVGRVEPKTDPGRQTAAWLLTQEHVNTRSLLLVPPIRSDGER